MAGSFILLLVLGQWRDALFGFAAVGNAVIGVVQEYRAKRALDRLAVINTPDARVLRDGAVQDIAVEAVVRDDILVLRAGDQVSADATLLDGESLEIDESLLTGEADPVLKFPGDDVLSGSSVVAGNGRAKVTRVGADSFASRLTAEAKQFSLINSEIRNGLNKVLRWVTWALLPIMAIVISGQMQAAGGWELAISSGSWRTAAVGVVASIIAMVPLGLVLLTSVAFAVSGVRLAKQKVLIQELAAVEVLARVDIICLDKTGTLTEGAIMFDAVHTLAETSEPELDQEPGWRQSLGWFGADPNANATARCLAEQFSADSSLSATAAIPFSSERKWSSVSFSSDSIAPGTWVLGAPELVLEPGSSSESRPGSQSGLAQGLAPMSAGVSIAVVLGEAKTLASAGMRTLVLAHSAQVTAPDPAGEPVPGSGASDSLAAGLRLPSDLSPVVLLTFREKVRSDAASTLSFFHDQGVGVRIISGDDPQTVAAVAREVGIHVEEGYDARELPCDLEQLADVMSEELVFGRVTPDQKKQMVQALQQRGHVVAMTGDGVNDALALKHADIGLHALSEQDRIRRRDVRDLWCTDLGISFPAPPAVRNRWADHWDPLVLPGVNGQRSPLPPRIFETLSFLCYTCRTHRHRQRFGSENICEVTRRLLHLGYSECIGGHPLAHRALGSSCHFPTVESQTCCRCAWHVRHACGSAADSTPQRLLQRDGASLGTAANHADRLREWMLSGGNTRPSSSAGQRPC